MPVFLDLIIPAFFGFTLSEFFHRKKTFRIIAMGILVVLICIYFYLKYFPSIEIEVLPKQSSIYLNGRNIGCGKKTCKVSFGEHALRLNYKNSPFFEESFELVQTGYLSATKILKTLKPKKGKLFVSIKKSVSGDPCRNVEFVVIYGQSGYYKTKQKPPFLFIDIPAGVYLVQIDYKDMGKTKSKLISDVCVLENIGGRVEITI